MINRIQLFPACNEGFRRLSFIVALLVLLTGVGWCLWENLNARGQQYELCAIGHRIDRDECRSNDCLASADAKEQSCFAGVSSFTGESFEVMGFFGGLGLMGACLSALAIRTLGWVTQGFAKA